MSQPTYTEDDYFDMIDAALNSGPEVNPWPTYALDLISTPQEWNRFKTAMARWLAEQDAGHREGFDQHAVEAEHDDDAGS